MVYRVRPGDTLYEIAQRFNTTVASLVRKNNIVNPNYLEVGQRLIIPDIDEIPEENGEIPEDRVEIRTKNFDYLVTNGLLIVFFTNKATYSQGENIRLNLIKVNLTKSPIELSYNTSQRSDFRVYNQNKRVWTWSQGRLFNQVTKTITLESEESQVIKEIWNQQNNNGEQVPTGVYRIRGWNLAEKLEDKKLDIFIEIE